MFEIKYRGPLNKEQTRGLVRYLNKYGKLRSEGWEKTVFLDTSIFPQIGDFTTGFSRISIKSDQRSLVLRIKEGNPSDAKRKERKITLREKELPNLIFLLDSLGVHRGFYRPVFRKIYQIDLLKISIKTKCAIGTHFEIELPHESFLNSPVLQTLLKRYKLKFWTKAAYQERIKQGMKKFPAVDLERLTLLN